VHFAGFVVDRPVISIRHAGGVLSSFEPVEPTVATSDRVAQGDVIGTLLPGHCSSPCLHLGARIDGEYVNPLLFLGGLEHAVLYPLE
jgi:murein DD-endopeptidase MepM/ murein hydrolase activator NlpD